MFGSAADKIGKHRAVFLSALAGAAFVVGGAAWAYVRLKDIPVYLILHYSRDAGIDHSGSLLDVLGMVSFGGLVVLVNTLLAYRLDERSWLLGKLVAAGTVIVTGLIFIGIAAIISANN